MKTFTTIELDKIYKVRFGMYELELLEDLTGLTGLGLIMKLQGESDKIKSKDLMNALYSGMAKDLPRDFTVKDLTKLVDEHCNLGCILGVISKAMELAFVSNDKVESKEVVSDEGK